MPNSVEESPGADPDDAAATTGHDATIEEGGSPIETTVAIVVCILALVAPLLYFQHRYELFIAESGSIKEGAASATLALAVIFRTVSRTVLRTIVRTSARAGMKASMKGALQTAMRVLFASMMKSSFGAQVKVEAPGAVRLKNLKSLGFASCLLYASWIIVVGIGQPFESLHSDADAVVLDAQADEEARAALVRRRAPAIEAFKAKQEVDRVRGLVTDARKRYKGERDLERQQAIEGELVLLAHDENDAQETLTTALSHANNLMLDPATIALEPAPTELDRVFERFFARAPFPGHTAWASPVLWLGGLVLLLPMWFIYFVQSGVARRLGTMLRHETGIDGGVIQLYFAGAFSFMPLTSDVKVEGTDEVKGKIALAGLLAPSAVAMVLWAAWKMTGQAPLLFAADAFLIYPMVQTFPLEPLDGLRVWRWNKLVWVFVFLVVMTGFMLAGSEGLKNVI